MVENLTGINGALNGSISNAALDSLIDELSKLIGSSNSSVSINIETGQKCESISPLLNNNRRVDTLR